MQFETYFVVELNIENIAQVLIERCLGAIAVTMRSASNIAEHVTTKDAMSAQELEDAAKKQC